MASTGEAIHLCNVTGLLKPHKPMGHESGQSDGQRDERTESHPKMSSLIVAKLTNIALQVTQKLLCRGREPLEIH
jgi:hypothetical protein